LKKTFKFVVEIYRLSVKNSFLNQLSISNAVKGPYILLLSSMYSQILSIIDLDKFELENGET